VEVRQAERDVLGAVGEQLQQPKLLGT
jgi:hypothetical protein